MGFKIYLDSHHSNHGNSKLSISPNYPEFGIEVGYNVKIKKELSVVYARLIKQYIIKYQTVFSATFDKQDENIQVLDETELFINLNINHNLTVSDISKINVKSPIEHQKQQMKISRWQCDKINSMIVYIF